MRLILVSNRLPITVTLRDDGFHFQQSSGGLATGLKSYLESLGPSGMFSDYVWIGWPGFTVSPEQQPPLQEQLYSRFHAHPVFLSEEEMDTFYHGFCNKTIWALFHYFPGYAIYNTEYWLRYKEINERFCQAVLQIVRPDDIIWVHDYHLMLLPRFLREELPDTALGFFLHIPFPSLEIFRLLPSKWRTEILEGLLGADLVGFHTHDYVQYFLRCVLRLLGKDHSMGQIFHGDRLVKVDTFPMGVDFEKFQNTALSERVRRETGELRESIDGCRTILSMDRLDYSKGISHRLNGYELFLERNPHWHGKVVLLLLVVPSRVGVYRYQMMKREIDELVGRINGRFGKFRWSPILYKYRSLPFEKVVSLYCASDVILVTPLRDGMNLIAKEYLASRFDNSGVLVLSEMAGAAKELGEALLINPNTADEIAESLEMAFAMPPDEQKHRNGIMRQRLERYNIINWAKDFLENLTQSKANQQKFNARRLMPSSWKEHMSRFHQAKRRILLLDYDGTLKSFAPEPRLAQPDKEVLDLINRLSSAANTRVVLITGRDKKTVDEWFPLQAINVVAEHGVWIRDQKGDGWRMLKPLSTRWMDMLLPIMELYINRLPGSFLEKKDFSLAFHYRQADPDLASVRVKELTDNVVHLTANMDVNVLHGNKVVEVRNAGVNKGASGLYFLSRDSYDYILAIGDDWTDEELFRILPEDALSIRVGMTASYAKYNLRNPDEVRQFLFQLCQEL